MVVVPREAIFLFKFSYEVECWGYEGQVLWFGARRPVCIIER